jgi:mycobactin lysine-N-oxygenase
LTLAEKRDAMNRTDRGVFSVRVQEGLLADDRIRHLRGRVAHAVARDERISAERVAMIGGGETAAAMLTELFGHRVSTITVISPQVTLFTRGEGFFENALFSDPIDWTALTLAERRDALARTDRGVFSARVQDALLADDRIRHLRGRVAHAVARDGRIRLTLSTNRGGENLETVHGFDLVIDGSGADPLWFVSLFGQDTLDLLELGLGGPLSGDRLAEAIGHDLAVAGVTPKLFLPNLAGLTQGPGFPNLSCLGLLSDRILGTRSTTTTAGSDLVSVRRTDIEESR